MSSRTATSRRDELLGELARAGRAHSDATVLFHAAVAERLGLNPTDHKVMSLLEREGAMPAGEIARRTGLASGSVTALVDRLEARGFARRGPDAADRRRVMVEADPAGVARAAALLTAHRGSAGELFDPYGDDHLAVILDFLTRSTERLRRSAAGL
jgi:DNA-binding MarR family transcriptional regulator